MGARHTSSDDAIVPGTWAALKEEPEMAEGTPIPRVKPVRLAVRVILDKFWQIEPLKETFKAQFFFEAQMQTNSEKEAEEAATYLACFASYVIFRGEVEPGWLNELTERAPPPRTKLVVENEISSEFESELEVKKSGSTFTLALRWIIAGEFFEILELGNFPFDSQDFTVTLRFWTPFRDDKPQVQFVDSKQSRVVLTVFGVDNTWDKPHRLLVHADFTNPATNCYGDIFPLLHMTVQLRRKPWFFISNVVAPMFIIVAMSSCSMVIPFKHIGARLGASLTLVLTAVAYKYNVAELVPIPGMGYSTWLDGYVMMCLLFLSLIVLENCLAFTQWHRSESTVALVVYIGFLICNIYFAYDAGKIYRDRPTEVTRKLEQLANVQPGGEEDSDNLSDQLEHEENSEECFILR